MKRTILFVVMLLVTGCAAPKVYTRSNTTQAMGDRDILECRYEAMKVEASVQNPIRGMMAAMDIMNTCMQMRGYQ